MGLSISRGLIEEHEGTISVESEPGQGATFVIDLPVVAPRPTPSEPQAEGAPPPAGPDSCRRR